MERALAKHPDFQPYASAEKVAEFEYFQVWEQPPEPPRKTPVYLVTKPDSHRIGEIKWFGRWRQFCFFPDADTVWSVSCLRDIQEAIALAQSRYNQIRNKSGG